MNVSSDSGQANKLVDEARDSILSRIKLALRGPSPRPHWLDESVDDRPLFFLPDSDVAALRDRFRQEFEAVMGEWHAADQPAAAAALFADWCQSLGAHSILAADGPLVRSLLRERTEVTWMTGEGTPIVWEKFAVGVTPCECLIAESGSIIVSSALSGRATSILPPNHLVVATDDQIVPDIETAIARLRARYGNSLPSNLSMITGPSRTADIEKILVLGAHGPRRLALMLLPSHETAD